VPLKRCNGKIPERVSLDPWEDLFEQCGQSDRESIVVALVLQTPGAMGSGFAWR
jgi:hypothetical protein